LSKDFNLLFSFHSEASIQHGSIAANMLAAFLAPKMLIRKFLSAFSVPKILIRVFEAAFSKPKIPTSIFGVKNAGQNFCFRKF